MAAERKGRSKGEMLSGISPDVKVEKVDNVWGSTAGAGSDFFHIYRKHRYTEMNRLQKMDEDWEKEKEADEFEAERERLKEYDEMTKEKRRKKRKRKQNNSRKKKIRKSTSPQDSPVNDTSDAEVACAITVGKTDVQTS
eukprot:GHVQ01015159.1.p1 GENE.GHVQ01015159.1~~GHVQ01015159.1.p1  ORF type:complete len:139 (+),score=23.40 GHVQ01015159.1:252-668(+)